MQKFFIKIVFARLVINIIFNWLWINFAYQEIQQLFLRKNALTALFESENRLFNDYVIGPLFIIFTFSFILFPPIWLTWHLWTKKIDIKSIGIAVPNLRRRLSFEGYTKRLLRAIRTVKKPLFKLVLKIIYFLTLWYVSFLLSAIVTYVIRYLLLCLRFYCKFSYWEYEAAISAVVISFPVAYFLNKYLIIVIYKRMKRLLTKDIKDL